MKEKRIGRKRLISALLSMALVLGMVPPVDGAWVDSWDPSDYHEEAMVTVSYDSLERTEATVTYTKPGVAAQPVNIVFLLDISMTGKDSSAAFLKMMQNSGLNYLYDYGANTNVSIITYQNTAKVVAQGVTNKTTLSDLLNYRPELWRVSGVANESAALDKAIEVVNAVKKGNGSDVPTVVFWVLGEKVQLLEEVGANADALRAKLAELQTALGGPYSGHVVPDGMKENYNALMTWQLSDTPSEVLSEYTAHHILAHDDSVPSDTALKDMPRYPAAHAQANAVAFQSEMATDLEQMVHDHYHNVTWNVRLSDNQQVATSIKEVYAEANSSYLSYDVQITSDGRGVDVTLYQACRQAELTFTMVVELDEDVYERQTIINAFEVETDAESTDHGALHVGLFDQGTVMGMHTHVPEAVVDRTQYTITFEGHADSTGALPAPIVAMAGQRVTLPGQGNRLNPGNSFSGWHVTAGPNLGSHYDGGDVLTMPEGDMTLASTWGHVEIELELGDTAPVPYRNQVFYRNGSYALQISSLVGNGVGSDRVWAVYIDNGKPLYDMPAYSGEKNNKYAPVSVQSTGNPAIPVSQVYYACHVGATAEDKVLAYLVPSTTATTDGYYDLHITADGGVKLAGGNCRQLFGNYSSVRELHLDYLDTSAVTSMQEMFFSLSHLQLIEFGSLFQTGQVRSMQRMFSVCGSVHLNGVQVLDLTMFDFSNVVDMSYMFSGLENVIYTDRWSNFKEIRFPADMDLSNVVNMSNMFARCPQLTTLDLSGFNTSSSVTNMSQMFRNCTNLSSLDVSSLNTSKVTNMSGMFYNCTSLTNLDVSNWDTSAVTNMASMFNTCSKLTTLDVSGWDTSAVTSMASMFNACSKLTTLDVSNWDTSAVTSMSYMFNECNSLSSLDVSNWDASAVTNMASMFNACSKLTTLDVSGWDTSAVTSMASMFNACSKLTTLDVSNWDTSAVTSMSSMFNECNSLSSLDVSNWDTSAVTNMAALFYNCGKLTELDMSNWNTSEATSMSSMFYGCSNLTELDVSGFDTSNVTTTANMFYNCSKLTELDVNRFNTAKVTAMNHMFYGCRGLTSLDLSSFDLSAVTTLQSMFAGCTALEEVQGFDGKGTLPSLSNVANLFYQCSALKKANLSGWSLPNLSNANAMFYQCTSLEELDLTWSDVRVLPENFTITSIFGSVPGEAVLKIGANPTPAMEMLADAFPGSVLAGGAPWTATTTLSLRVEEDPLPPEEVEAPAPEETPVPEETESPVPEEPEESELPEETEVVVPEESEEPETVTVEDNAVPLADAPQYEYNYDDPVKKNVWTLVDPTAERTDIEYLVHVKYMGDETARSGRITVTYPLPDYVTWNEENADILVSGPLYVEGVTSGLRGGWIVEEPKITTINGVQTLTAVFEGLYANNEFEISLHGINTLPPTPDADGYYYWDGVAYGQDSATVASSNLLRLWYKEDDATPPELNEKLLQYVFEGDVPSDAVAPAAGLQTVGSTVTTAGKPASSMTYYTFDGWYRGDTGEKVAPGAEFEMPDSTLTLTGKWTLDESRAPKVTVVYQYAAAAPAGAPVIGDSGNYDLKKTNEVVIGKTFPIVQISEDEDYHSFGGWVPTLSIGGRDVPLTYNSGSYTDADGKYRIDPTGRLETEQFRGESNVKVTLTGEWIPYTGTIRFDANGGTGTMTAMTDVSYDTTATLPANGFAYASGFNFGGWSLSSSGVVAKKDGERANGLITQKGQEVTLYAIWVADTYNVVVNLDGKDIPLGGAAPADGNLTISNTAQTVKGGGSYANTLTARSGYAVKDITVRVGSTDMTRQVYAPYTGKIDITAVTGDIIITATSAPVYTVRIQATGATAEPSGTVSVAQGNNLTVTFTPNNGYEFQSLTVDGQSAELTGHNSYTIHNITANHTISVVYRNPNGGGSSGSDREDRYPIHVESTGVGEASSDRKTAEAGDLVTITTTGKVESIVAVDKNGNKIPLMGKGNGVYAFVMPSSEVRVRVTFHVADPDDTGVSGWLSTTSPHIRYLNGYPDGTFGPEGNMTRAEAAQMFYNLLLNQNVPATVTFEDVPANAWYYKAVNTLAAIGVVKGVGGNNFAPERPITRAEFTVIAMRFADLDFTGENFFTDVSESDWFYHHVVGSIKYGWITGYADDTFRPYNYISRAEVAVITNRMLERIADKAYVDAHNAELRQFSDLAKTHWAYYDIMEATNAHEHTKDDGVETWTKLR